MRPTITFIACSFDESFYNRQLIDSLMMQTDPNWKVIIYQNGASAEMREWVSRYNDPRVIYLETESNNGNGCINRLDAIYNHVDTEYVIQTSIQDYYLKWAVELILNRLVETKADICFWDSINHLSGYEVLIAELKMSHIDWGNFCFPLEIAKKIGIPGIEVNTRREDDWYTIARGLELGLLENKTRIANVLTIHN